MKLAELSWPQVEAYLKKSKTVIVPVGSTEQHGPTGIIGIDYLTSEWIGNTVAQQTNQLITPPLCFGMAQHHMAFPGTISFSPQTYVTVICEIIDSLVTHGFQNIQFINGHGGNIAPITTAFSQALMKHPDTELGLINWWHLKEVQAYEQEHFGKENGFHATCGEVSVTMFTHPEAYQTQAPYKHFQTLEKTIWPLSPSQFRKTFPDGRMSSNPGLSTSEHGEKIFNIAVQTIAKMIK